MTRAGWTVLVIRILLLAGLAAVIPGLSAWHQDQIACEGGNSSVFILQAQAVPSATQLPCFSRLPVGWSYGQNQFRSGVVRVWLDSDRAGDRAIELDLTRTCDVSRARRVPAHVPAGMVRYDEPIRDATAPEEEVRDGRVWLRRSRFAFTRTKAPAIFEQADHFLRFTPRAVYVNSLRTLEGLTLCGSGAPPCPG